MRKLLSLMGAICLAFVSADAVAQGYVINKKDGTKVYYSADEVQSVGVYNAGEGPEQEQADNLTFTVSGVTFKMIRVKAGTFQMGSSEFDNEKPVHQVTLTKDYYMGETEVTQGLWYAVMGQSPTSDGYNWSSEYGQGDNYPAYWINYKDCQSFLMKLNTALSSQLGGKKFRMPTEAEWEFAAKGGNASKDYTYAGSNTIGDVAWYYDNSGIKPHEVGGKKANELGLYDMSGNVSEWCYDWYGSYSSTAQTDPTGATSGPSRVLRGGDWIGNAASCRVGARYSNSPTLRGYSGFRLALGEVAEEDPLGLCPDANHPHAIDMGTGVKFACCNVGAESPVEYGDYFAWGETTTEYDYRWNYYKYCNGSYFTLTKYCDSSSYGTVDDKTQLEPSDDAASANWGGTWRMPTIDELSALNSDCTWTWTTVSNIAGYKVTASNGNMLFFPAAGEYGDTSLYNAGSHGFYWSSSLYTSRAYRARAFSFGSNRSTDSVYDRCNGLSVRPVQE